MCARRGGGGDSSARRPGADGRCASPVVLPRTLPRPFWAHHCRLCWSSAGADGVPSSAGNGAGSGQWSPLPLRAPAGDPTPITQVKVRTRAKSITGFSLSKPVPGFKTGYLFSGSRLTSLKVTIGSCRCCQPSYLVFSLGFIYSKWAVCVKTEFRYWCK